MSKLTIYSEATAKPEQTLTEFAHIRDALSCADVLFERWDATQLLADDADQQAVLNAYADDVARLNDRFGFKSIDVMAIQPDHPDREAIRAKFLDEHRHDDFEVRFFVDGQGLFYIRTGGKIYAVLCERGDLISVPANMPHWFDTGAEPCFKVIRLFVYPEGWVPNYTGNPIAKKFPLLESA